MRVALFLLTILLTACGGQATSFEVETPRYLTDREVREQSSVGLYLACGRNITRGDLAKSQPFSELRQVVRTLTQAQLADPNTTLFAEELPRSCYAQNISADSVIVAQRFARSSDNGLVQLVAREVLPGSDFVVMYAVPLGKCWGNCPPGWWRR